MPHPFSCVLALGIVAALPFAPAHPPQHPPVKQRATERYNAAKTVWERLSGQPWESLQDCDSGATWSRRLAESAADAGALTAREAFTQHLTRMQDILATTKELYRAHRRTAAGVAALEYHVAEARSLVPR